MLYRVLAFVFGAELFEQNNTGSETFSEKDKRRLNRFERKEKDDKLEKELSQEIGEFLEERLSDSELVEFKHTNGITEKKLSKHNFIRSGNGTLSIESLDFGTNTVLQSQYEWFVAADGPLGRYILDYNNTISWSGAEQQQVVHDIEQTRRQNSWILEWQDTFEDIDAFDDIEKQERKIDKFEAKSNFRNLEKMDDLQDALVDEIKEILKTNETDLNKRQRKELSRALFNKLYEYDDFTSVPASLELVDKKWSKVIVNKAWYATIFIRIHDFKQRNSDLTLLQGDKKMERYKARVEKATANRDQIYKEYVTKLAATQKMTLGAETIDVSQAWHYKSVFLLADINLDGQMVPAHDLGDDEFKRNWLGKVMVEWVLRSVWMSVDKSGDGQNYKKYTKSFKNQPINNNLETQISTAREIANARVGNAKVEENMKELLGKAFDLTGKEKNSLYELLVSNIEYSIFLKRIFIMESDILVGLFEEGPQALDTKYSAALMRDEERNTWIDTGELKAQVDTLITDPTIKQALLDNIDNKQIDQVVADLRDQAAKETDANKKKELEALVAQFDNPQTQKQAREKFKFQLASGGLMAILGAMHRERHQVIATYSDQDRNTPVRIDANGNFLTKEQAYNPDGTVKDPNSTVFQSFEDANTIKDKIKRTNFVYGLGTGWTIAGESSGRYKQSITYGVSALYTDFAKNDPSNQKDGFSFWLSLAYNGSLGVSKEIGSSWYYGTNINFGVGAGMGVDTEGSLSFGPFAYVGADQLLNKGRLKHTLDGRWATRLRAWATLTLDQGILNAVPNIGVGKDRIEWYQIIEDNLKTTLAPLIEDMLHGLKGKTIDPTSVSNELLRRYRDVVGRIDEKLGRSKAKNIRKSAEILWAIIQTYIGTDAIADSVYIKQLAPQLATIFANQRWNENIEDLRWLKLSSLNVGSIFTLALFGVAPISILAVWLGTVGATKYARAVAENEKMSLASAEEDIENNYSVNRIEWYDPLSNQALGVGGKEGLLLIQNTLRSIDPAITDSEVNRLISNENGTLKIHKDLASKIEIRIWKSFIVEDEEKNVADFLWSDDEHLLVPLDMVGWLSEMVDKNTRRTILSIGREMFTPLSECIKWNGTERFDGHPENFDAIWGYKVEDIYAMSEWIRSSFDISIENNKLSVKAKSGISAEFNPAAQDPTVDMVIDWLEGKKLSFVHHKYGSVDKRVVSMQQAGDASANTFEVGFKELTDPNALLEKWSAEKLAVTDLDSVVDSDYKNLVINKKNLDDHKTKMKYRLKPWFKDFTKRLDKDYLSIDRKSVATYANQFVWTNYFTEERKNELLHLNQLMIGSIYCDYTNVKNGKSVNVRSFGKMVTSRETNFEKRSRELEGDAEKVLWDIRKKSLEGMYNTNLGTNKSYEELKSITSPISVLTHNEPNLLWFVYGFAGEGLTQDEKLVTNPKVVDGSQIAISDERIRRYIFDLAERRYQLTSSNTTETTIKTLLQNQLGEITKDVLDDAMSTLRTWVDNVTVEFSWKDWVIQRYNIKANYQFFVYEDCMNESVGIQFEVTPYAPKDVPVDYKPLEKGQPWPTGMRLNDISVMQRAATTAVNVGLTAAGTYTKDVPEYVTTDIQIPETPTTIPEISVRKDGVEIQLPLAPGNGYIMDLPGTNPPLQLGIQFTGYATDGTPTYYFTFMDSEFNTLGSYYTLAELQNWPHWSSIHPSVQEQLIMADNIYKSQIKRPTTPATWPVLQPATKSYIAKTWNTWFNANRHGMITYQLDNSNKIK